MKLRSGIKPFRAVILAVLPILIACGLLLALYDLRSFCDNDIFTVSWCFDEVFYDLVLYDWRNPWRKEKNG